MPEEKELATQEEEEEEEEEEEKQVAGISQEDFNKWKSNLDGQVRTERQARQRAEGELNTLRQQFDRLEKSLLPQGAGFEYEEEEEAEEEEDIFEAPKKKKKAKLSKGAARRFSMLEQENKQLKEQIAVSGARNAMAERISHLLADTGVSRNDSGLDWAADESDPEEGYARLQASAIGLALQRREQKQQVKKQVQKKKEEVSKVETGGPKTPVSSVLERWKRNELSEKEKEDLMSRAKRRTKEGRSELDISEVTS